MLCKYLWLVKYTIPNLCTQCYWNTDKSIINPSESWRRYVEQRMDVQMVYKGVIQFPSKNIGWVRKQNEYTWMDIVQPIGNLIIILDSPLSLPTSTLIKLCHFYHINILKPVTALHFCCHGISPGPYCPWHDGKDDLGHALITNNSHISVA